SESVEILPEDKGSKTILVTPLTPGIIRLKVQGLGSTFESNPCVCIDTPGQEKIFFGDYHKHCVHCDGYLEPEENYEFASSYAFLDFGMLSSHDMQPFHERGARNWKEIRTATEEAHEPGSFVTFQAYEWTHDKPFSSQDARGHKVVIFLNPDHLLPLIPFFYEVNPHTQYMPPTTLLKLLKDRAGHDVIVIPHHLPLYKWWFFPEVEDGQMGGPLPEPTRKEIDSLQPVAEVFSKVHGNNESYGLQNWIKPPTTWGWPINFTFWEDALMSGVRAGAAAAGDNHGSPLGHLKFTALTAVTAPQLERLNIFRAIQRRHTYATSGPRVVILFNLEVIGAMMGDIVTFQPGWAPPTFSMAVFSPLPVDLIEVVKVTSGHSEVAYTHEAGGVKDLTLSWEDTAYNPLDWVCYYLRVHLDNDSQGAWTSPIWLDPPGFNAD
ncbi:MAG: DUF3604 domain-containing protein, partial [Planctomycetota bacterium]